MFHGMATGLFRALSFLNMYTDNLVLYQCSLGELFIQIITVCDRKRSTGLRLKLQEGFFAVSEAEVLGQVLSRN